MSKYYIYLFRSQLCNIPGTCVGQSLGFIGGVSDPYECLEICQGTTDCAWFTVNPDIVACNLYANCSINIDDCPTCISGMSQNMLTLINTFNKRFQL